MLHVESIVLYFQANMLTRRDSLRQHETACNQNKIQRMMLPRIFGAAKPPKLDFRTQQGLLQMYLDWCEPNPSCRNCSVVKHLGTGLRASASKPTTSARNAPQD